MQYALIAYDLQLILAQMPQHPQERQAKNGDEQELQYLEKSCHSSLRWWCVPVSILNIFFIHRDEFGVAIHVARVSASFRHGMTTDTSRAQEAVAVSCSIVCSRLLRMYDKISTH